MCANCGAILSQAQVDDAISMMHDTETVTVSRQEAERLDSESTRKLLDHRKLALIVDLDQTIIHATVDPTVGEWLRDPTNPNFEPLKGVGAFRLGLDGKAILEDGRGESNLKGKNRAAESDSGDSATNGTQGGQEPSKEDEGCWYYVKPRPGLANFLKSLSEKYELHVYTMGTRSYADCVCRLVDPDGSLFGTRILSRDENGSLVQKSLSRLFPMDTSMVVIIDDRGDVWGWSPNLVKVIPYDFFIGSGDINATFLPALPSQPATPANPDSEASSSQSDSSSAASPEGSDSGPSASASTSATPSTSPSPSSPKTDAGQEQKSITEQLNDAAERETEQEADNAAKAHAEQSQKSAVSEQLDSRPLAKMQEQLDEKLGVQATEAGAGEAANSKASEAVKDGEQSNPSSTTAESAQPTAAAAPSTSADTASSEDGSSISPPSLSEDSAGQRSTTPPTLPPRPRAVLQDDDIELHRVKGILDGIHTQWYKDWDAGAEDRAAGKGRDKKGALIKPTVKDIISDMKKEVLKTCDVVFSSLIPLGGGLQQSDYFWLALEYGASCSDELRPETTHVIAAKPGTAKVISAQRRTGVTVVWPNWLHDSIAKWAKQPEEPYLLPIAPPNADEASSALPTEDELSSSDDEGWEDGDASGGADPQLDIDESASWNINDGSGGLSGMDWAEADKELEEYLNGSDGDSEDDYDQNSAAGDGYNTDGSVSRSPSRRGKRSRRSTPSTNGDTTAPRTPSKLRNSTTAITNDASESPKRRRTADHQRKQSRSGASTASNATSATGDETLLRDLEDELEAALGGASESETDERDTAGNDAKRTTEGVKVD
ncbi:unnamed protein product [Sympodiomycopsis kandeliae]